MAARVIGLDVGTNAVRAVEVELTDPPRIRRMGQVGLEPGAVIDGEVTDVLAVTMALRRLWAQVGFKSHNVRVGMSSARVIIRTFEMPVLPHDELLSTIRLQLDDYVPLPADETIFDIRIFGGTTPTKQTQQMLLAATHQDALEPLVQAIRDAGLDVVAVDVIPAALALALTHPEAEPSDKVDVVLSIGAGTVVMVAAHAGESLFSRTLTNVGGRLITEGIAEGLGIDVAEAELHKRLTLEGDPTAAPTLLAAAASVDNLIAEVRDSLTFYAEQEGSMPVRRLVVTGGGSQFPGLVAALSSELDIEVELADTFGHCRLRDGTGFEPIDLPYLAPYMAAALGVALGAGRPKERRINLAPPAKVSAHAAAKHRTLAAVGAVVLVGASGAFYASRRMDIADEQDQLANATVELADLQVQILAQTIVDGIPAVSVGAVTPGMVVESVAASDIDWINVEAAVKAGSDPLGVTYSSFQGALVPPVVGAAVDPAADPRSLIIGRLTLTATAPGLLAVADWLDTIAADPAFAEPWAGGLTIETAEDGSTRVQFTMEMLLTSQHLVLRSFGSDRPK